MWKQFIDIYFLTLFTILANPTCVAYDKHVVHEYTFLKDFSLPEAKFFMSVIVVIYLQGQCQPNLARSILNSLSERDSSLSFFYPVIKFSPYLQLLCILTNLAYSAHWIMPYSCSLFIHLSQLKAYVGFSVLKQLQVVCIGCIKFCKDTSPPGTTGLIWTNQGTKLKGKGIQVCLYMEGHAHIRGAYTREKLLAIEV